MEEYKTYFRCVVGGHAIFEAKFELGMLVDDPSLSKWTVHMQRWPTRMLSGLWSEMDSLVSSRDAAVFDTQGAGIPANELPGPTAVLNEKPALKR